MERNRLYLKFRQSGSEGVARRAVGDEDAHVAAAGATRPEECPLLRGGGAQCIGIGSKNRNLGLLCERPKRRILIA